jgi:hypothetical protein
LIPDLIGRESKKLNVAFLDKIFDEIGGFFQIQFLHDIGAMTFNGMHTDNKNI